MAQVVWTDPSLSDLDAIADFIALEDPEAARRLVARGFHRVAQLAAHSLSGSVPRELRGGHSRQLIEPPLRVFYRVDGRSAVIVHVVRHERRLKRSNLKR